MVSFKRHPALFCPGEGPLSPHFPIKIFSPCHSEKLDRGALLMYEIANGCRRDVRFGDTRHYAL